MRARISYTTPFSPTGKDNATDFLPAVNAYLSWRNSCPTSAIVSETTDVLGTYEVGIQGVRNPLEI
jgi:hypothetical protein